MTHEAGDRCRNTVNGQWPRPGEGQRPAPVVGAARGQVREGPGQVQDRLPEPREVAIERPAPEQAHPDIVRAVGAQLLLGVVPLARQCKALLGGERHVTSAAPGKRPAAREVVLVERGEREVEVGEAEPVVCPGVGRARSASRGAGQRAAGGSSHAGRRAGALPPRCYRPGACRSRPHPGPSVACQMCCWTPDSPGCQSCAEQSMPSGVLKVALSTAQSPSLIS